MKPVRALLQRHEETPKVVVIHQFLSRDGEIVAIVSTYPDSFFHEEKPEHLRLADNGFLWNETLAPEPFKPDSMKPNQPLKAEWLYSKDQHFMVYVHGFVRGWFRTYALVTRGSGDIFKVKLNKLKIRDSGLHSLPLYPE